MLDDLVVDHIHHVLKHQSVTKELILILVCNSFINFTVLLLS